MEKDIVPPLRTDAVVEIFTEGSSFLFEATNHRVYWKNITILVPQSWTHRNEYKPSKTETFDRANVRIDYGVSKSPYALLVGKCGKQGQYINLTPQYVRNKEYAESGWGPRDKTIVHEWAHLRWGVFDEYPTDKPFFKGKRKIEATRCSESIAGTYVEKSGRKCSVDPLTGVYTKTCQFVEKSTQKARVSIMYKQFINSIRSFCSTNEVNPSLKHFVEAPNKQNDICERKGVWDVMMTTDDFRDGRSPQLQENIDTTPSFQIVQPTARRVVLVLDTSGSMQGDPLNKLRQAATLYIESTIDIGSYLGIVGFYTRGTQLAPLTLVANDDTRETLKMKLPSSATGGTSIGNGVLKGIEVLSSVGQSSDGGYLLVISDGQNTHNPDIDDVLDDVIAAGVIVDTIAFTDNADTALGKLSTVSGGNAYFYSGSDSIAALIESFTATITSRPDQTNQTLPITLYSEALAIDNTTGTVTSYVIIDTSVGVDTVFLFAWLDYSIAVVLENSDGQRFDNTSEEYSLNSNDEIITIRIKERALAGRWNFEISNQLLSSPSHIVTVTVESKQASADEAPVILTSFVSDPFINYQTTPYITIFAFLSKGNEVVANADVIAVLERPNAPHDIIQLYDSGTNADLSKYDGVYSAYFFNFTDNGRYSIEVKVRGNKQTESVGNVANARSFPIIQEELIMKPVNIFERSASGGAIQVSDYVEQTTDFLQPSRIMDLTVTEVSYQDQSATLQWTAVGDDFDKGTVSEYDLRFAETFQEITTNFSDATKVTSDDVINGNLLAIKKPGQTEEFSIRLPNRGDEVTYYFAIMAIDEANNTGGLSNVVSANLEYIPPLEQETESNGISTFVWILVAIGVAGVLMFVLIGLYIKHTRRSTTGSDGDQVHVNPAYA
ncbi:calcium-activated chloride channel regulator 1-like [Anneissia japonica]|uniref:calcium-activated chloride channel regulator 1-like n=1 Tax=Anneissia japonica TaxID=1529436 RepID=UPI001425AE7F|nr:calcium-activated chloride channel regulator 1-like [Anneissia japonica]